MYMMQCIYISIKLHVAHEDFLSSDCRIRMVANNLNLVNSYQFSLGHSFSIRVLSRVND